MEMAKVFLHGFPQTLPISFPVTFTFLARQFFLDQMKSTRTFSDV